MFFIFFWTPQTEKTFLLVTNKHDNRAIDEGGEKRDEMNVFEG